jgi:alkaline phosphatase
MHLTKCLLLHQGGRIDSAHHENKPFKALNDTVAFQDAVALAQEMTDEEDTLIIVTADHSHVFTITGYAAINAPILGKLLT